jgi:hypothetical protein
VLSGSLYSNHFAVSAGNGWWRIGFTNSVNDVSYDNIRIGLSSGATVADLTYTGDGTSGILLWGAQLELGSVATDYQRITDLNTEVIARFPTATLYQDTAGTTPVTTTGQSVGLMLDKSKGLVLGPENVVNGTFDADSNWTKGTGWTIAGGVASANIAAGVNLDQSLTTTTNKSYVVTFTITSYTSGGIRARLTGAANISGAVRSAVGTYTEIFHATATNSVFRMVDGGGGFVGSIDNISVKELPGNHAVQATTANRPTYGIHPFGGRRNLLTWSEDLTNAAWTKANATVSGSTLTAINSSNSARVQQSFAATSGQQRTATFRVSAGTSTSTGMRILDSTNTVYARIDMTWTAGVPTIAASTGADSATITSVGGGEYDAVLVFTPSQTATQNLAYYIDLGSLNRTAVLSRTQLETGPTATAYQRVTDQYNVTEAGVPSVSYLFFDGVNDSMATPTITPGVDKAQVFAGVRNLQTLAVGAIVEHSASTATNNGAFILAAREGVSNYFFGPKGTVGAEVRSPASYPAPITNTLTGLGDISGDSATLRVNGTQVATSTTDQGTGNFLAYPLYLGARAGTSLFFSGHLYSLIARFGANLAAGQISSTETWVAGKTGITI